MRTMGPGGLRRTLQEAQSRRPTSRRRSKSRRKKGNRKSRSYPRSNRKRKEELRLLDVWLRLEGRGWVVCRPSWVLRCLLEGKPARPRLDLRHKIKKWQQRLSR